MKGDKKKGSQKEMEIDIKEKEERKKWRQG